MTYPQYDQNDPNYQGTYQIYGSPAPIPTPAPPTKNRRPMIIGAIVAAVLVIGGGTTAIVLANQPTQAEQQAVVVQQSEASEAIQASIKAETEPILTAAEKYDLDQYVEDEAFDADFEGADMVTNGPLDRTEEMMIQELGFRSSITEKFNKTRPLDGTLEAESKDGKYTVKWSFRRSGDDANFIVNIEPTENK